MKEVHLTKGMLALVDDEDYERVMKHKWCAVVGSTTNAYAASAIKREDGTRRMTLLHRFVWNQPIPEGMVMDHINGCSMDNRKTNLRVVTQHQNTINRGPNRRRRFKGAFKTANGTYLCNISINGRSIPLGYWLTEEASALAYNKACSKYHGEYGRLNRIVTPEPEIIQAEIVAAENTEKHDVYTRTLENIKRFISPASHI